MLSRFWFLAKTAKPNKNCTTENWSTFLVTFGWIWFCFVLGHYLYFFLLELLSLRKALSLRMISTLSCDLPWTQWSMWTAQWPNYLLGLIVIQTAHCVNEILCVENWYNTTCPIATWTIQHPWGWKYLCTLCIPCPANPSWHYIASWALLLATTATTLGWHTCIAFHCAHYAQAAYAKSNPLGATTGIVGVSTLFDAISSTHQCRTTSWCRVRWHAQDRWWCAVFALQDFFHLHLDEFDSQIQLHLHHRCTHVIMYLLIPGARTTRLQRMICMMQLPCCTCQMSMLIVCSWDDVVLLQ